MHEKRVSGWNDNTHRSRLQAIYDSGVEKGFTNTTLNEEVILSVAVG